MKDTDQKFTAIPHTILNLPLAPAALGIMVKMCQCYDQQRRIFSYSEKKFASICGLSERQINRYFKSWQTGGYITVVSKGCQYTGSSDLQIPLFKDFLDRKGITQITPEETNAVFRAKNASVKEQLPTIQTPAQQTQTQPVQSTAAKTAWRNATPEETDLIKKWNDVFPENDARKALKYNPIIGESITNLIDKCGSVIHAKHFLRSYAKSCEEDGLIPKTPQYILDSAIADWQNSDEYVRATIDSRADYILKRLQIADKTLFDDVYDAKKMYCEGDMTREDFIIGLKKAEEIIKNQEVA